MADLEMIEEVVSLKPQMVDMRYLDTQIARTVMFHSIMAIETFG